MPGKKVTIPLKSLRKDVDARINKLRKSLGVAAPPSAKAVVPRAIEGPKKLAHAKSTLKKLEQVQVLLMSCCCTFSQNCEYEP